MSKLEQLEKAVVDTKAAYDAAHNAWDSWDSWYDACADCAAWRGAWEKAELELSNYLKEQDNDKQRS